MRWRAAINDRKKDALRLHLPHGPDRFAKHILFAFVLLALLLLLKLLLLPFLYLSLLLCLLLLLVLLLFLVVFLFLILLCASYCALSFSVLRLGEDDRVGEQICLGHEL